MDKWLFDSAVRSLYNVANVIYLGADHRGFALKEEVKKYLEQQGYEFRDLGNVTYEPDDDYPDFAFPVAHQVADNQEQGHFGIVICGSAVGACIAANKVVGARAGIGFSVEATAAGRADDDMNVLCLSADYTDREQVYDIVETFLTTDFSGEERHQRRLDKIKNHEDTIV